MNATTAAVPGQMRAVQVLDSAACCGVSAHVRSLTHGLVERGVQVTVCGPVALERDFGFISLGARFRTVELGGHTGTRDEAAAAGVLRYVCSSADVVHAHGLRAGVMSALALRTMGSCRGARAPLVITMHSMVASDSPGARLPQLLERRMVRAADVVLGASSDLVTLARELGAKDARLAPVAAPVALAAQDAVAAREKVREWLGVGASPLLLSIGQLAPGRGFRSLLDASRSWRALDPLPLLVIAGEGPLRESLQERIDVERLPVRLLGGRDDVPELFAASDLVIVPSRWEGRSLVAQEALRSGIPLVATAVGGVPDLVGDAAVLVPYGDVAALGGAVSDLVSDPRRRAALVARGRVQAATWPSAKDTVAQVLSIYDELTSAGPR